MGWLLLAALAALALYVAGRVAYKQLTYGDNPPEGNG